MSYSEDEKFMYARAWNYFLFNYITNIINTIMHVIKIIIIASIAIMITACDYTEPYIIVTGLSLVAIGFMCMLTIKYNHDMVELANTIRKMGEK